MGDLRATYDDHLRLIGKRVGDFLLVLFERFLIGVTAEALRANIGSTSATVDPKFQVEEVTRHEPFLSENWVKWSFIRYKNLDNFSHIVTIHGFDRRTVRETDGLNSHR